MGLRTHTLGIGGMQCPNCATVIEAAVAKLPGIREARADYRAGRLRVSFDPARADAARIAAAVVAQGYTCAPVTAKPSFARTLGRLLVVALALATIGWLVAEGGGFAERFHWPRFERGMSYGLLFLVGLLTGFHCIGMCGGFVVGYAARTAGSGRRFFFLSHLLYGFGKTLSYATIGGAFGLLGAFVAFTPEIRGYAAVLAGAFLVLFGINMLDWFPLLRRLIPRTPRFLARFVGRESRRRSSPFILGLLNGLMIACGPLQAMYVMAAGTGDFREGATLLLVFGLGTLPLLWVFGLLAGVVSGRLTHHLLRASGVLVVALGLMMLNRGLILSGSGWDFHNLAARAAVEWGQLREQAEALAERSFGETRTIRMAVTAGGYAPNRFVLRQGQPVRWIIEGRELTQCNHRVVVPGLGLEFDLAPGENVIEFTPERPGLIPFSCWMGMLQGSFVVEPAGGE